MNDKKQKLILSLIAIVTLFLVAIGAAYAFFASQNTGKKDVNINAKSGTTDVLTFEAGEDIGITANKGNFASGMGSEEGQTIAKARLTANDATSEASDSYYVYLKINTNELRYTNFKDSANDIKPGIEQADKTIIAPDATHTTKVPELILTVKETNKATGETKELTQEDIEDLTYYDSISTKKKTTDSTEDVTISGFDITETKGMILLKYENIHTSNEEKDEGRDNLPNMTTHEWEITVTLINLDSDQNNNTGKTFDATLVLQKDQIITNLADACGPEDTIETCVKKISNEDYEYSHIIYHNTSSLSNTNIANKTLSANDNSYRFSGSSEEVKNYVCLDGISSAGECQNGDADLYRIIGFFPNDAGEYEMKLIKYDYATKEELGDKSTAEGGAYQGNYSNTSKDNYKGRNAENIAAYYWNYTGSGIYNNMWQYSNLNQINLNQFYYNYISTKVNNLENHITEHEWTTGGFSYSISYTPKQVYDMELGEEKLTTNDNKCYAEANNSTAQTCIEDDLSYKDAKIGLMYINDYGYAAYPEAWNQYVSNSSGYSSETVKTNNWMYMGLGEWAISRNSEDGDHAWLVYYTAAATSHIVRAFYGIRPTFYLDSSTKIISGNGTHDNPFRLSWN